ncbi:MAG: immunoglobulin domain-containing protein, partial [Paludibacteraceae bacterium]|nr:immunoglobulin domain-containing protein [Paludibacteraceae bacterium]
MWQDDFGVEEDSVVRDFANPNMSMPGHKLADKSHLNEACYGIMNSTAWSFIKKKSVYPYENYHFVPGRDHTGNPNGAMLVVNGRTTNAGDPVYEYNLDLKVCGKTKYRFSMFAANVSGHNTPPLLILEAVNVKDPANPQVLVSAPLSESDVPKWNTKYKNSEGKYAHDMREWGKVSIEFEANTGDKLQIRIRNNSIESGGNDFGIDDIMLERDDAEEIVQPQIDSELSASTCKPLYSVTNAEFLDSWKNVYDNVYFLWQFSTDDGYTWSSIDEASGIEKTMLERDAPKTGSEVYRLVVVGGNSVAEAKSKADEFSKNGVLSDGCDYISISNTISQMEAETVPAASVGIDAISKTQQLAYDCYALSHYVVLFADGWDKRYPSGYSFLWQYSSDNGKTWNEYNETSKEFLFTDNFEGPTLFRAVLAKNDAILKKVVEKGTPDNICGEEYLITNQVSIECEQPCQVATFKPLEDDFTFCSHIRLAVGLEAVQTNQAPIEKREWFVRTEGDADWTFWDNSADNKLLVNSPGKTTWYGFVASDGKCVSDTVIFKMNVHPEIILKPIDDIKVCEGGDVELKVTVLSGKPTSYIWDSVQESTPIDEGGADAIIVDITSDLQMTLSATDGICSSDVMDVRIFVEKMPVVNVTPLPVMVCEGSSVSLNADAVLSNANTFAWKKDGVLLSDSELSLTDIPTSDASYTFSVYGDVCPVVEKTVSTTVEPKIGLSLSASATEVCEGDEVTLTANELYSTPLQWLRKSVADDKFSEFGDGDSEIKVNVENDVEFAVFNPGPQVCPRDTPVVAVMVEKKASVTLEPLPDIVCRGEIVHLVADAQLNSANKVSWLRDGTLVSVDHLTIDQMPDEDVTYTFVIKGDKCPAVEESVSTKVEQRPHIELDHYHDAVCVNSEVSVSVNVDNSPGFVWMQKKNGDDEYAVMSETGNKLSFSATESVDIVASTTGQLACQSVVTAPLYVYVEDSVHFEVLPIPDTVCLGTEIVLKSLDLSPIDSDGSLYPWYKERDWTVYDNGFAEKMPVITLKEPVSDDYQLIYIPEGNTVFEFVVEGAYCPSRIFRDSVYVIHPFDIFLSAEKELVCEGETPKLEVQNPKNYQLVWKKSVGNEPFEVFEVDALGGLEESTSFMVTSRETEMCPDFFPNSVRVDVEPKATAEIADLPQLVCEGGEVKLDATMQLTNYNSFKWLKDGQPLSAEKQVTDVLL